LAVILPFLLVVLVGATDFGRVMYLATVVSSAASAGARYAAQSSDLAGDLTAVKNAALNDMGTRNIGRDVNVETERYCTCAPTDSAIACASLCSPAAGYPTQPRMFVRVRVQSTFDTLLDYPGLPTSVTIVRQSLTRAQ